METNKTQNKAFTLIELLVVVGIIGLLTAVALPNFSNAKIRAQLAATYAQLKTLKTAINSYSLDHDMPPLTACPNTPLCRHQYVGLTTPVAYINGFGGCEDVFAPTITLGGVTFKDLHYWYYGTIVTTSGEPMFYRRDRFALMSWGPDRAAYVWVTLSRMMSRRDGREWIKPYLYSPSNGLVSGGDIIVTDAKIHQ